MYNWRVLTAAEQVAERLRAEQCRGGGWAGDNLGGHEENLARQLWRHPRATSSFNGLNRKSIS
jgi:hypothetical protein